MRSTMTWVGLDVHARSVHAAALDTQSGELQRARLGGETTEVLAFLEALARRAELDHETTSAVIRKALRKYLGAA